MTKENLYYLALIPPPPLQHEVRQIQEHIRDEFGSKASLKSPPHITVHMPFRLRSRKENILLDTVEGIAATTSPFIINLDDFNHFGSRVVYLDVVSTKCLHQLYQDTASVMRKTFHLTNADYKNRGYHPHVTIAFRDLNQERFQQIWTHYSNSTFQRQFEATGMSILKHNGQCWNVLTTCQFNENSSD